MARLNISISDELKNKMDLHPGVNWSQTASEAFREKINKIESSLEVKNMSDAIARINASKQKYANAEKNTGHQDGILWAMKEADYIELKRIDDYVIKNGIQEITNVFDFLAVLGGGVLTGIDKPQGASDAIIFEGQSAVLSYGVSEEYMSGFINGVLEVCKQVLVKDEKQKLITYREGEGNYDQHI